MQHAPLPENEAARLAALQQYGILDTPAEEGFDDLSQLAAQICGTPIALVSLVDAHRQWFKARVGIDALETPRDIAFCAHAIHGNDLFVVPDATQDQRFADNPLVVTDPNIRFYAGMPLVTPTGHAVGTLCVIDRVPKQLTTDQMNALRMLGRQVVSRLELKRCLIEFEHSLVLREKYERLMSEAQTLSHIGSWEWDVKTGVEIWSDEQFRIFGYEPHTIKPTFETFRDGVHPDDQTRVLEVVENALKQNQPYQLTCRIVRPSKEIRDVLCHGSVLSDAEGHPTGMVGTIQDITEQKTIKQIMADTLRRLDLATKSHGTGVWDYYILENRLVWDEQMYDLYGYTKNDFPHAYEAWSNRLHPEDKPYAESAVREAINRGTQFDTEFRLLLPDQSVRYIKASAVVITDERDQAVRMIGINYDITARKEIEAARLAAETTLREKEELTRAMIENVIDYSIIRLDPEGHVVSWNQGSQRIKGYTEDEIIGRHFSCFYTDEDQASGKPTALLRKARAHHHAEVEGWRVRKDGSRFWANVVITSLFDHDGRLKGFTKVLRDRTERKAAEGRLEQAARDVEARNRELAKANQSALAATRAKSEFLATMSHEIRTPMNAIVGMAELLQETPLTPDQANYVSRFSRAAASLMELINAILDISKIEAGHMTLEAVPFDLPNLADTIAELMADKALAKGLELLVHVHPDVPQGVVGDPTRLNQVLVNLVSNAIKFTESGHVMITVEPAHDRSVAQALHFSVSDTGIGIPPDKLRSIFEPFTQVDSTTTRKYGGTGLGLSISQHLVELMGGRLEVDSTLGVGTTFSFTITLPEALLVVASQTGRYLDLHAMRLLIVDENEANVMIVREHLSRSGAQLLDATSGAQALTILDDAQRRNEPIALAILDYHMPGMNGLELAQAIRNRQEFATLPLIMHVSDFQGDDARRARSLGITSYLYKPLSRRRLMDSLAAALNLEPVGAAQREETEPSEQTISAPCRILLVEDLEDNRDVIALFLKDTPYQLDMAGNGAVALQKFQTGRYDLVLMDMQMPVMDGLEATAAIREWERAQQRRPTPIVALTANAFKEEADRCLTVGCTAHLTKPIKKKTLLSAIAQCTDTPRDQVA